MKLGALALVAVCAIAIAGVRPAAAAPPTEDQLKAALLSNADLGTEWGTDSIGKLDIPCTNWGGVYYRVRPEVQVLEVRLFESRCVPLALWAEVLEDAFTEDLVNPTVTRDAAPPIGDQAIRIWISGTQQDGTAVTTDIFLWQSKEVIAVTIMLSSGRAQVQPFAETQQTKLQSTFGAITAVPSSANSPKDDLAGSRPVYVWQSDVSVVPRLGNLQRAQCIRWGSPNLMERLIGMPSPQSATPQAEGTSRNCR